MRKLILVVIVACGLLSTAPAGAWVQPPPEPIVQWFQPISVNTIGVCPLGDWTSLDVTMKDGFGYPLAGYQVSLSFADARVCDAPVVGFTDVNGYVRLVIKSGLSSSGGTARVTSGYTVTCMGYTIRTGTVSLVSPDYDCSQGVDALDFSYFSLDWQPAAYAARSDFNNDLVVDALDFSLFALHWLHTN